MKIINILKSVVFGVPVGITIIDSIGYVARVDGTSMQPALNPNEHTQDFVFLNRWCIKSYEVQRGDVISLISPKDPSLKIIKRVVGVQGDIIATLSYKLHIVKVPEGHCWVEGDHTGHSMDSNNFGPVSLGLVTAKASCIVWPPSRWQFIQSCLPDSRAPLNLSPKMRAISLVNRIEFQFMGNVARNAVTLGDVDNDGCNELIVGNNNGEVAIFKGKERIQKISDLSFVSCVAVGDIFNKQRNSLVIVTADGWCYIYEIRYKENNHSEETEKTDEEISQVDGQVQSGETLEQSFESNKSHNGKAEKPQLVCVHIQRIPANAKNIVLGDIDNDGMIEMILGLTDRVVRSYRWFNESNKIANVAEPNLSQDSENMHYLGKLVALNKWECANQIGSITLHHSGDGTPSLLIAQPGGTFMRIKCQPEDSNQSQDNVETSDAQSIPSDTMPGSAIDYQFLGRSRMRNPNISTEILGDFKTGNLENSNESFSRTDDGSQAVKRCPYAVATLDGTIMLVQDEVILWAIAVDHQIFALTKLDVTGNGFDDIVVCSWDGQTYILDQEKNSVRFHLDEPVQAFHSGFYNLATNEPPVTCLVYITFKNTVILYYDIPLRELKCKKYEPEVDTLSELYVKMGKTKKEALEIVQNLDKKKRNHLIQYLLYNVKKDKSDKSTA